jgi:hypothetical protein
LAPSGSVAVRPARVSLAAGVALVVALCTARDDARADHDPPSTRNLVLAGAAMAVPAYFVGVLLHEGSHAVWVKSFGGTVTEFHVLPGRNPRTGAFHFGYVSYRGQLSRNQKAAFLFAPRLTDLVLLGGYTALVATDTLPHNHYGQLAVAVAATPVWVDFTKDVFRFGPYNDMVRLYSLYGKDTEWQRLPYRLLHAGVAAAAGYVIYRGYERVFDNDLESPPPAFIVPLTRGAF